MPNFDRTGPMGQGAMTGRKRGRCRDTQTTQIEKSEALTVSAENKEVIYGLGRGGRPRGEGGLGNRFGFGHGRGRGRGFSNK